ncbi:hypothetical protein ZEAMMB73_Zm00001d049398 [Zea mays]|uniref:Inositol 1,3,4-trisphosphate 5/6-kinase ATP-grasp domain-containing protein n=1 Tax=Zea mays TaxID=4577 RepID=A0A1D6PUE9_MAIZE|nr:hypothetical protein ZEAMMB73_Zm00001d049398 [Zea mays]
MFKVYIVGDAIRVVRQFSLPNVDEGDLSNNAGGLRLFDIDMIREHGTRDRFYVIDMNYFLGMWLFPCVASPFAGKGAPSPVVPLPTLVVVTEDVFSLIVEAFMPLDDIESPFFGRRTSILDTVTKVWSCVVMLDLECDDLINDMFHHFLVTVKSQPVQMMQILTLVLLGLRLFDIDMIREHGTRDRFYVIDMNYFLGMWLFPCVASPFAGKGAPSPVVPLPTLVVVTEDVFSLIVEAFMPLDDIESPFFGRRTSILDTVTKVWSCVVMLDLECDDLINDMFHHFLVTVKSEPCFLAVAGMHSVILLSALLGATNMSLTNGQRSA